MIFLDFLQKGFGSLVIIFIFATKNNIKNEDIHYISPSSS